MKDIISNLVVSQAKTTMLESIKNTDDINFLKKEFTKTLNEKWQFESNWNELKKWLKEQINNLYFNEVDVLEVLDKMQELEGKDERN